MQKIMKNFQSQSNEVKKWNEVVLLNLGFIYFVPLT